MMNVAVGNLTVSPGGKLDKAVMSDQELSQEADQIVAAKADPRKFKVLYQKYFKRIFLFVQHKTGDQQLSADITSEVFLKALSKLQNFRFRNVPFSAWLYRIAINEVYQFFRKNQKVRKVPVEDRMLQMLAEEVEENELADNVAKLEWVLQKLSPKDVQLIELRYYEGHSFKEVADILNITENNAKVKVHRLLKKLKKLWH